MAVKVTLRDGSVENFDGADDQYVIGRDDQLTVFRGDGTRKVFKGDAWKTVDGKEKPPSFA
jgi:hypothetical protein